MQAVWTWTSPRRAGLALLTLLCALALAACGGHTVAGTPAATVAPPPTAATPQPAQALPANPLGLALPAPQQLLESSTAGPASSHAASTVQVVNLSGADFDPAHSQRMVVNGSAVTFSPLWLAGQETQAHLAYALYHFNLTGYTGTAALRLHWTSIGHPDDCYLALPDFGANRWRFYPNAAQGDFAFSPDVFAAATAPGTADFYVVLVATGTSEWDLADLHVGQPEHIELSQITPSETPAVGGTAVMFASYNGSEPSSWHWDFGAATSPAGYDGWTPVVHFATAGTFTCHVTATAANGQPFTQPFPLTVLPAGQLPPNVLTVTPTAGHAGDSVRVDAIMGNGPPAASWQWDFGGGATPNTSPASTAVVTLGAVGDYPASVTLGAASGASTTLDFTLHIAAAGALLPPQLYAASASTGQAYHPADFTALNAGGAIDSYAWDFGGGALPETSTNIQPDPVLRGTGIYLCSVTATNAAGSSTWPFRLLLGASGHSLWAFEHDPAWSASPCLLWGTLSPGPVADPGPIWSLGSATAAAGLQGYTVTPQLAAPGDFDCAVTATTPDGPSTLCFALAVQPLVAPQIFQVAYQGMGEPGRVASSAGPARLASGELGGDELEAVAYNQGGPVTSWSWDFGGGANPNTTTDASPILTFGAPGTYSCHVMAINAAGSQQFDFPLVVDPPPPPQVYIGEAQFFENIPQTVGANVYYGESWQWDFGGSCSPNTSTDEAPLVTPQAPGLYVGRLTVTNSTGSASQQFFITVYAVDVPQISQAGPQGAWANTQTGFYVDTSNSPAQSWSWDFGGGCTPNTSTAQDPLVQTLDAGTYTVTVTATNWRGSDVFTFPLTVQ